MKKIKSVKLRLRQFLFDKCFYEQLEVKKLPPHLSKTHEEYVLEHLGTRNYISEEYIRRNEGGIFEIEYEPERKFIDVRIEYSAKDNPLSRLAVENILAALNKHYEGFILENLTVTELNQGWTDEDMIEFVKYYMSFNRDLTVEEELEQFKAERKSK